MFSLDTLIGLASGLATVIAAVFGLRALLTKILDGNKKLIEMHENPDKYGFGTGDLQNEFEANTRALKQLIHYTKYLAEVQSSKPVPPPVNDI